jgi:hypothetical protein
VSIGPAPILSVLVGGFHTAMFLFVFGRVGLRTVLTLAASILGAWAGDAIGGLLGVDPFRLGDFHLLSASLLAWAGIAFVEVLLVLGPDGPEVHRR